MKKCIILIDGSNFYFKLKDLRLQNLLNFDFKNFGLYLSNPHKLVKIIYFIGKIRTDGSAKSNQLLTNQQKHFSHLKNQNVEYQLGYLLKYGNKYHEKGVDVNLAINILISAYEKKVSQIILISSDTDLLPAIKKAIVEKTEVKYIGFEHKPSRAMISNCSSYKLLTKKDIAKFIKKSRKQS